MTVSPQVVFNLKPLTANDIPSPADEDGFAAWLDAHFAAGQKLIDTMDDWTVHSKNGALKVVSLPSGKIRKSLGINEYWCGRISRHDTASVEALGADSKAAHTADKEDEANADSADGRGVASIFRTLSRRLSYQGRPEANRRATLDLSEHERQDRVMNSDPRNLYERFRRGLLEYHSENEREYIESCRETACLQVFKKHIAEVWRLTYVTPPPTNPRTFVVLLLSRELRSAPHGQRAFMNVSIPFSHPDCPEKVGAEKQRVRGKYVSVELVRETEDGDAVEWRMATSSDAGGNIPRFITNSALPKNISEDVPSFLRWMVRRFPLKDAEAVSTVDERSEPSSVPAENGVPA